VEEWILMAICAEECVPDIFQREMPDFDKIPLPEYKPFRYFLLLSHRAVSLE
jgi:hypothetical protein